MERIVNPTDREQTTMPKALWEDLHMAPETTLAGRQGGVADYERTALRHFRTSVSSPRKPLTPEAVTALVGRIRREVSEHKHLRPSYLYAAHHGGVSGSGVALSMVDAVLRLVPTLFLVGLFGPSAAQRKP